MYYVTTSYVKDFLNFSPILARCVNVCSSSLCILPSRKCPLSNIVDAVMILLLTKPLPRESIEKDCAGHCPAQALWASFSGFGTGEAVLLLAGFRKNGLVSA
jgi:hypothetical protein